MKTLYRVIISLFCYFIVLNIHAQSKFDLEIYGGLNYGYFQSGESLNLPDAQFSNSLGQHVGLNFLPRLSQNWQLSIQTEWMRSAIRAEIPNFDNSNVYNPMGNYILGARYNVEKGNHAFFFQPGVGMSINNISGPTFDGFGFESNREIQLLIRGEAGVKFYNSKKNYFVVGIRHQQGLAKTNPYGAQGIFGVPITGRNSYTGVFVGYGINTDNWSKSKREKDKPVRIKRENPWSDGVYVMGTASLRRVLNPIKDPQDDFQNVSPSYMLGAGYRVGDFSAEAGYANFRGRNVYQLLSPEGIPVQTSHRSFSVNTVPITLRYDRPLPINRKIRAGISFTAHIPLGFENLGEGPFGFSGTRIIDETEFPYSLSGNGLSANPQGIFFNSGIYTEMPFFRTGLIAFKASINYGSPAFDRAQVAYEVSGVPNALEPTGVLNGLLLEVEYRLPLHHIFGK